MTSGHFPVLARTGGFDLLGPELGADVECAIRAALSAGAVFADGVEPLAVFRNVLGAAIRDIEGHPRGRLFQEFLLKGPYEDAGAIPVNLRDERLSDADTAKAVTFIHSHMVNCFKGAVTELLAANACVALMKQLRRQGQLPRAARLYVGDSVLIPRVGGKGALKGADLHMLVESRDAGVIVAGVAEVKSCRPSAETLRIQLDRHVRRTKSGLRIRGIDHSASRVRLVREMPAIRVVVVPDTWKLPRAFRFDGSALQVEPGAPPGAKDEILQTGPHEWQITLRWSQEALAEAAHAMTFWYMGKVGEVIYSKGVPATWKEMSPSEAGENAVKMMLYYAILRCGTSREQQRAVALYNSYCFGYAIGMSFRNEAGRREMLWPEDLEQILALGRTANGCTLH